ncbi:16S rRNA (guanine(966)-N(2))-methyltransferase RsmD [Halieaceae bacterium IMCC14734]|uniref:Ribosomal RNA small subunit methyltransferase D n=1 Tax=Candidatus Litorirhabdus singularis TaxID=2518993 RepID=A0ABT3TDF8_9GAMM|nr:16S rRNA (guanine(966)-N(2))-methyltransferase RsmD [Candidatus Litorirhabdus singularis]MCX2980029.1 16S rRNA (guanine(966)-N(2))-methyltransferase RsmD [Candidatus Litorirhabdus singularis]
MAASKQTQQRTLRIIGGQWRGRKLAFPDAEGLRPTPDRVRETLFNWLATDIRDARCLDLFAGSGALGLEALSRGAASCTFVDSARANCRAITEHLTTLECSSANCQTLTAEAFLRHPPPQPFDIVFLDPPFAKNLLTPTCTALESTLWLSPHASIYVESGRREPAPVVPENWRQRRDKQAGEVRYQLFVRDS